MPETVSATYTSTPIVLLGTWVFDPTLADTTEAQYLYVDPSSRTEEIDPGDTVILLNGRTNPIVDYGIGLQLTLKLSAKIPFDSLHDAAVAWWRTAVANKRALCYRDGRGRLIYCSLTGTLGVHDAIDGTVVAFTAVRVDYSPVVT